MKVTVSFSNIDHTPSLDERINEKSKKFEKYFDGRSHVKWNCYVKDSNHYADIAIVGPQFEYHATASSDSLYKTIDKVVNKIEKQLHKKKDKVKNKMHQKNSKIVILDPEAAWSMQDDDYEETA